MNTITDPRRQVSRRALDFTAWSPRTAALVAGLALAVMAVLAGFGKFGAIDPLITPGDATATAVAISGSSALFLSGVGSLFLAALLDFLVAAAWFTLFAPVHRRLSAFAAWTRVVYTVLFLGAIGQLAIAFTLLDDPEVALRALEAFDTIWLASLGLFGIHLLVMGYLTVRSGFIPKVFGILLALTGVGYIADAVGVLLSVDLPVTFGSFAFVGEVAIILWLLVRGRRLSSRVTPHSKGANS